MKAIITASVLTVLVVASSCKQGNRTAGTAATSYGVEGPLATPRIFGEGIISTDAPEFGISFSPDGRQVYFNRMSADRSRMFAVESQFVDGKWQPATPVTFVDTTARNVDMFVTPDGQHMMFSSTAAVERGKAKTDFDTWSAPRDGERWGTAVHLPVPANSPAQDIFVSATRTGTLYFASERAGNSDIYRTRPVAQGYAEPERLSVVNTPASESNPVIASDESFLVFASERPEGLGGSDLYVATRVHGTWTTPRNLGTSVNSPYADFAPALSPDGKYLFFTSERPGVVKDSVVGRRPGDVWQVEIQTIAAMR